MIQNGLAVHETLELHEILAFKNVCLTKAKSSQALVSDEQLMNILRTDIQNTTGNITELQQLLTQAIRT